MSYSDAAYLFPGPTRPHGAFRLGVERKSGAHRCIRQFLAPVTLCAVLIMLMTGANAADLDTWSGAPAMPDLPADSIWAGPYAGAEVGLSETGTEAKSGGVTKDFSRTDAAFGLFAGYNWRISRVVVGVEGSAAYLGGEAKSSHTTLGNIKSGSTWSASIKGRVGLPIGRFMPYLSAGVAATDNTFKANGRKDTSVGIGPVLGAGLEVAVTDSWRVRADYSLTGIMNKNSNFGGATVKRSSANHRLMLGVAYAF